MIDEKKLIEDIDKQLEKDSFYLRAVFKELIYKQPKTDWIPCEERLPIIHKQVLGTTTDGRVYICIRGNGHWYKDTGVLLDVIAWQTLPHPYKKEGAE